VQFLLDTNVISETQKRAPDPRVLEWLGAQSALDLWISVLTLGELTMGSELAGDARRDELRNWIAHDLARAFVGRLLLVDDATARAWGRMSAEGRSAGRELPAVDGLLLATASVNDLVFVTRNERDCANRGVAILNPWV
jgi:toxin FitB